MLKTLSKEERHLQLELLKTKRMSSSQEKIKKVAKKRVKTPVIVESDDECELKPIHSSKPKAKGTKRVKNQFIDFECEEDIPEQRKELEIVDEQEVDYVASDVEELKTDENENHSLADEPEEKQEQEEEEEEGEEKTRNMGEIKKEIWKKKKKKKKMKSDMKIVTKDGQQMLFCSAGTAICSPPFATPATFLALREMSKAVHPKFVHAKKGTPPRCHKHDVPMALSFCKSASEKFAHRPVFKCAVRSGKNPLTNKEDSSFVKCADGLFGDLSNLAKARNEYEIYQAQVAADKARAIRSKNLVVKSLKVQEAQDRLAGKKRKSTSDGHLASKNKVICKTPVNE
ncbi:hypothetical protein OS493_021166 [Desmophyllum pertusum]|uniref:Uncharacterized protein n=1 Tax=Desmophyllum pertusum TaxID=174260 RepID=A0A9W9ZNF9_9CNID|nr:hypothetical protein OS493_021166 [Desmophyllum pertusum]